MTDNLIAIIAMACGLTGILIKSYAGAFICFGSVFLYLILVYVDELKERRKEKEK